LALPHYRIGDPAIAILNGVYHIPRRLGGGQLAGKVQRTWRARAGAWANMLPEDRQNRDELLNFVKNLTSNQIRVKLCNWNASSRAIACCKAMRKRGDKRDHCRQLMYNTQ